MEDTYLELTDVPSQKSPASGHILWQRIERVSELMRQFSPSERLALYIFSALLAMSTFLLIIRLNDAFLVSIPEYGGSLTEGEVGPARFINPILAISAPDKDMVQLVYSGLMRAMPDGSMIPDIAESYTISADGTIYTFKIRTNATFQDNTPVTSADVVFTVKAAQNSALKSTRQADWVGVTVSAPDIHTIVFTLPHAYAPFMEDTTIGILPAHLWKNVSDQEFAYSTLNTHPVGSGPYRVTNVGTDSTGSVTRYDLAPFSHFTLGRAYISNITLLFYPNDSELKKAFAAGTIDSIAGVAPQDTTSLAARRNTAVLESILPRVFAVFLNQSHNPALADLSARKALDAAVDKQQIVDSVLLGYGSVLDGPIPHGIFGVTPPAVPQTTTPILPITHTPSIDYAAAARTTLQNGRWKFNTNNNVWEKGKLKLNLTIATADEPELIATAKQLVSDWRAAGIQVEIHVYPISDFNTTILRPRNYDAILFGEVVGRGTDLFAFWDSSQRNDPGLNLSMYANTQAGTLLAKARATSNEKIRTDLYSQFAAILKKDAPAIFLYSPAFMYILPTSLHGIAIGAITTPAERFLNVYEWYTQTERVWSVFAKAEVQN